MDTRYKFSEVFTMFKILHLDYKNSESDIKKEKRKGILRTIKYLLIYLWNGISAPIIYPFWYLFRIQICAKIYNNTSWQEINSLIENNKHKEVNKILKPNGKFWYWLWTYGDLRDPLGEGEIVNYGVKNNFFNRYKENAFRNARFTINFMKFNTSDIVDIITVIDKQNPNLYVKSWGLGDKQAGVFFAWMIDEDGDWNLTYRDLNVNNYFYYGYVGLGSFNRKYTRFEVSYRKTDSSYVK